MSEEKTPRDRLLLQIITLLTLLLQAWATNYQSKELAAESFQKQRQTESELVLAESYREFILDVMDRCECGGE